MSEGLQFVNWARTYGCKPAKYFEPKDQQELSSILALARDIDRKVRMVGCGHSPSDICCTPDFLVSMKYFNAIRRIDERSLTVTAEAGVELGTLIKELKIHNMALSNLPSITQLTIGGAISTGTHGTGIAYPGLAGLVLHLELMQANGQVLQLSNDDHKLFQAAIISLGSMGVILTVELQCEPLYHVTKTVRLRPISEALATLENSARSSDHFRMYIYPYVDCVVLEDIRRVPPGKCIRPNSNWFWDTLLGFHFLELLYYLGTLFSCLVKYINRAAFHYLNKDGSVVSDSYENVFTFNCLFRQHVMEYAVDLSEATFALKQLKETIESRNLPLHFPIEVRFARRDDFFLSYFSPCYGRDSCYINIVLYRPYGKEPPQKELIWKVFADIMQSHQGRPHLAKDHSYDYEAMAKTYPKFEEFCRVRQKMDSENRFSNNYLSRLIEKR